MRLRCRISGDFGFGMCGFVVIQALGGIHTQQHIAPQGSGLVGIQAPLYLIHPALEKAMQSISAPAPRTRNPEICMPGKPEA